MTCNTIYTINREYCSGGRSVGEQLAKRLGIPFYDKKLVEHAASQTGINEKIFQDLDERPTNSFLYSLVVGSFNMGAGTFAGSPDLPMSDRVFIAESDVIREAAGKGPCVIVGRCANYILRSYTNVINVFLRADMQDRMHRAVIEHQAENAKLEDLLLKTDKRRASYYNYYTGQKWNDLSSYDLCLNTSLTGIEGAVDLILSFGTLAEQK